MRKVYEAWAQESAGTWVSITFATADGIQDHRVRGLLASDAKLMYRIEADTLEEAQAVHHIKMGWAPYKPSGKPAPCPNSCGAIFYPKGSGECPKCGKIC